MPSVQATTPNRIEVLLRQSPLAALHTISVDETDDAITLTGTVGSWYFKQIVEEIAYPFAGSKEIINNIKIPKHKR